MNSHQDQTFVIVGGGLAAASAAGTLREEGFAGRLVLIGAEPHLPYERPPLSKGYLAGDSTLADAFVHAADFYETGGIDLRLGSPATALDVEAHTVVADAQSFSYDRLLLATGSTARRLPAADRSGAPVTYLRTIDDAQRIKLALAGGLRIMVVGGGWIGLEVAAAARTAGCNVMVVEPLEEPLLRVLGPTIGHAFATVHRLHGVDLRTSTSIATFSSRPGAVGRGPVGIVELDDGTATEADLIVVGIGAVPNVALAEAAGLKVEDGLLADEYLTTSHPDVFVAGDIANAFHPGFHRNLRVEHWDNAKAQGSTAARNMLGAEEAYERLPYFFTDQYDLGMEYVGHLGAGAYDELVVRGDLSGVYTAFWVRDRRVQAAMHVNDWESAATMTAVVAAGDIDVDGLRDPRVPLGDLVT
jgi:3-phenylpropionate/trans-cinnamate dioxygenase ferredoxin reductase component